MMLNPLAVTRKAHQRTLDIFGSRIIAVTPPISGENKARPAIAVISSFGKAPRICTKLAAIKPMRP